MEKINKLSDQDLEQVAGGVITQEEALAAAMKHAGVKKDQVEFVKKVELDWEHGRKIYEIEFYKDGFEYEFDVDAETGAILKHKKDWD
ncbi:MAG: PepSY domain-containing protein [Oscillospiraceae bacterium]|nr:PepSY domain-containing protein [Oscillospiraceae bacterium]MBO5638836.1 PepSY domain-containing protein [Oscillospiraceae bacterium]